MAIAHPDDHLLGFPPGTSAACLSKCDDASFTNFFNSGPSKWKSKLEWYYRHAQSPLPYDDAVSAFKSAAAAVPSSRNSCGMDDRVDAKQVFRGETNIVPGVGVQNGVVLCTIDGLSDGTNVIGWGYLPGNTLAVTCASATLEPDRNRIAAMDMRLDKAVSWFKGNGVPANCSDAFSLRGVATHEFGHAFGLGHTNRRAPSVGQARSWCPCASAQEGREVRGPTATGRVRSENAVRAVGCNTSPAAGTCLREPSPQPLDPLVGAGALRLWSGRRGR